ncbi:ankyrin [Colletotrichum asianum]
MIIPSLECVYPPNLNLVPPRWRPLVNIICVHDIGGSPKTTWHHDESGKMWISDPEFLGNFSNSARVWSYGYNSDPAVNMTPSSIALHANELLATIMAGYTVNGGGGPTIFIAHGLGGVIVKKAVILSLSCPEYFNIRDSIGGIVFLDTVHHGTDSEGVLKAVKTIAALCLQKGSLHPSRDDTRQFADAVREVNTTFLERLPSELEMLNFIAVRRVDLSVDGSETHKTLVVPKRRAELDSSQSKTFTIDCDHFQLTRFPSPENRIYLQLAEQVGDLMTKVSADTSRRVFFPPAPPVLRNSPVPRPPSPDPDIPVRPRPPPGRAIGLPPGMIPAANSGSAHQSWLKRKNIEYTKERRDRLIHRLGTWNDAHLGHDIDPMLDTCTWIETHPFFLEWSKSNATEDFYVYGSAGCGKTYLAKSVANHLSQDSSRPWDLVFSFFCNASSTGNKKPPIMEHFIREILRERQQWFEFLSNQFLFPDADGKFSMAALFGILRDIMSQLQLGQGPGKSIIVYLIVDGLHECDVGFVKEFLALVASLVDNPVARSTPPSPPSAAPPGPFNQFVPRDTVRFKFFTTYTPNEVMAMASVRATRIKMKDQDIRKDIAAYVDKRVEDFSTIKSTKDSPTEVADSIKDQAESFFVYANCSMEDGFSTARDDDEYGFSMSRRIFPYPQKLGKYYDYNLLPLFQNIGNDNYALSALHIILGTIGHVRGNTLRDALACLHDNPRLKFIDIQTILMHQCPRLIRVSDEFEAFPLHPSLRIHFNSYISEDDQHANMASLCLKYLTQPIFGGGLSRDVERENPFYHYAARNWRTHFKLSGDKRAKLIPQVRRFFNSSSYRTWSRHVDGTISSRNGITPPVVALITANAANIIHLVVDLYVMDDPETYPWQTGVWGFFWRLKQNTWRDYPRFAMFIDSFRERHDEMIVDEAGLSPLMHAAKEPVGLPDMVRHFLQRPFNINRKDYATGATALMFFCRFNTDPDQDLVSEMIDAFMKAGADVNMSTFRGETPLWLACSNGNPILVEELLRVGANPNISDKDGSTPIHQAFSKPTKYSYHIIDKLSRAGADLNIKFPSPDKLIPMTAAIVDMHFDIFLHLIDNIEDINQRDAAGFAAIHLLMQPKYADWLPHLLERRDLSIDLLTDSESSNGAPVRLTALSYAITEQNFQAVELLLRAGANPDRHPQASDKSPLFVAVDFVAGRLEDIGDKDPNGNLDIAELLISYNSSINTINPKSKRHTRSPLMLAVKNQNYPMVELLLKHGADPTLEEAYNLPGVLDAAVYGGNVEILKLLLEHSLPPSVNYVPKDFDHILIEAAEKDVELVKLLLDHGADTKRFLAPGDPRTPLQAAVQEGNLGLCKLFLEYEPELVNYQAKEGLVCETPLNIAAREGHLEIVRCLLEAGAKPNFQSFYYQETPLWSACSRGKFEIAKLLYERAPETINTPSYDGETPLMGACSSGAIKLVAFLLDNGADLTPRCSNCGSCVWKALTNNSNAPAYKMIKLLIQHGLGVDDVVSSVGFTVLGEACRSGDLPAVRYLLDLGADPVKGQLCPGKEPSDNSWRSAAQVVVDNREPGILDALLHHSKVADFIANADVYGETVLHTDDPQAEVPVMMTMIHNTCERLRRETGMDHWERMLRAEDFGGQKPLDTALGGHHKTLTDQAVANADEFIAQYVAQLVKAQHRTIDDHFYIIRMLSRLLLLRTGYDDEAVRLIQAYVVDPWVREKDDRVEEAVFCEYYCDECGKDAEEETLYFCRFCVWTTGRCCFPNYKGMHEPIEVPLVMERRIMDINSEEFMGMLRVLEQDFVTNKAPRVVEPAQKELFKADPESEDTTLSLAFLHSLGYLEFRRRAWSPYLPLAPKIYKRIEPWESFMRQERKEFQKWVYLTETAPWRLENELQYFLESGRKTAYKDVGTTIAEEIMRDVGVLFHEPRRSRSPRMLRPDERGERGPRMLSDEESD